MSYFNFNYVTDPPNDETVNYSAQLNANWQEVADKIDPFNHQPAEFGAIDIPIGTEALDPTAGGSDYRVGVWTGSQWAKGLNPIAAWTVWQNISIRAPRVARITYEPQVKIDTVARRIVLRGGVAFTDTNDAWPTTTTYEITTDTAIQAELAPVNGESIQEGAPGQILTANGYAGASVIIAKATNPDRTSISIRYRGDAGGGNFVMLDGIEWWY